MEALLFNGEPPVLEVLVLVLVLVLPTLKAVLGADVVDDDPMTLCELELGTAVVAETGVVDGIAVFGVLWGVPLLVLITGIVIDGTLSERHVDSNARKEMHK